MSGPGFDSGRNQRGRAERRLTEVRRLARPAGRRHSEPPGEMAVDPRERARRRAATKRARLSRRRNR